MNAFSSPVPEASSQKALHLLFLGPLRAALQMESCSIACPPDGSQESFWKSLLEQFPELKTGRPSIRLARQNQFLLPEERLEPGDEVALIPPVSGG